jgi:hypothetical protein
MNSNAEGQANSGEAKGKSLQQLELTIVVGEIVRDVGAEDSDIVAEDLGEIFSFTHGIAMLKG